MKIIRLNKETNEIQRAITLRHSRNNRYRYQEFLVEGRVAIDEACRNGWKLKSLFFNKDQKLSHWAQEKLRQELCEVAYEVTSELMDKISDKTESAELVAIAQMQRHSFDTYCASKKGVVIVLDEPKSAGNVGMLIRSAVAFGATAVVISGHGADEYDPKCIRASVGTFFTIPLYHVDGIAKFTKKIEELKTICSTTILATGDQGTARVDEIEYTSDLLFLVLGNETSGVSAGFKQLACQFVRIPLPGRFTSLNIAAAGSVLLYEIFRHRTPSVNVY